jgi:hypothetical protein
MPPKKQATPSNTVTASPGNRSYDIKTMTFSGELVACLLLKRSISKDEYNMMSALDGTRTASALQHQFRAPLRRAREIEALQQELEKEGKKWEGVTAGSKRCE